MKFESLNYARCYPVKSELKRMILRHHLSESRNERPILGVNSYQCQIPVHHTERCQAKYDRYQDRTYWTGTDLRAYNAIIMR